WEVLDLLAHGPARPDLLELMVLFRRAAFIEVEHPPPRGAFLVVAVAPGHDDAEVGEVEPVGLAVDDLPGEDAFADPMRRTSAGDAVDPSAGTGCGAVTGFGVRAAHAPAHAALRAITCAA